MQFRLLLFPGNLNGYLTCGRNAALIIANGNATTPDEVRVDLTETAEDKGTAGWDEIYGWGLVNASAALGWTPAPNVNQPPVANAGLDQSAYVNETAYFDASDSYDPDGTLFLMFGTLETERLKQG